MSHTSYVYNSFTIGFVTMKVKVLVAQSSLTLCKPMDCSLQGFSAHGISQQYWSGLPSLLQGIFLTQGLNPGLLHCGQFLYHLNYQGSLHIATVILLMMLTQPL